MIPYNNDSFSTNFESMSLKTQFNDSSNKANIFFRYIMMSIGYGQPCPNPSSSTNEEYEMFNNPSSTQISYHISYQMQQEGFQTSTWITLSFPSMERLWVGVKKFLHDIFVLTISIIETLCLGMNIVFNKMKSFHLTM